MESKELSLYRKLVYILVILVASLPLVCSYVMEGGDVLLWLNRIEEVKSGIASGKVIFYPTAELISLHANKTSAFDTNLWLVIPALFRLLGLSITNSYRLYMLLLNVLAVFAAMKMFEALFDSKWSVLCGVVLYVTCPYRVYLCYDKADLGMVAAWSLVPLFVWGMIKLAKGEAKWWYMELTALVFAGIGYADGNIFLFTFVMFVIMLVFYRKWKICIPVVAGSILFLPGAIKLLQYLLNGGYETLGLPLQSIAGNGYSVGQMLASWTYLGGHPGLGLGLLGALFVLGWLAFTEGNLRVFKQYGMFVVVAAVFAVLSTPLFVWDLAQRVGAPLQRWVALVETPGICFGFVCLAVSVPATYGMVVSSEQKNIFVRVAVPLLVILASLANCIYLCNMLTYNRMPMFLTDSFM